MILYNTIFGSAAGGGLVLVAKLQHKEKHYPVRPSFNSQNSANFQDSVTPISTLSPVFGEIQLGTCLHCS